MVHQLPAPSGFAVALAISLAVAITLALFRCYWGIWFALGAIWTSIQIHVRLADRLPADMQGVDLAVVGWVDGFPRETSGQTSFSFRVVSAPAAGVPERLRLTWYEDVRLRPGDDLQLIVRLKRPHGVKNPGGFDYERWLFLEGYGATGYVRQGKAVPEARSIGSQSWLRLRAHVAQLILDAAPSANAASLLLALTIGERFAFTAEHWETLRRTGTSHLFAISGLHVGLVAGLAFLVCRRLMLRLPASYARFDLECAAIFSFCFASIYAALAGFTVPTQRALIMSLVALVAVVSRRSVEPACGIAAALLLVLIWDPFAPLSEAFWLSFLAVALIIRCARETRRIDGSRRRFAWVFELIRLQLVITLGLAPLIALFFAEVSLVAPIANLFVIPIFGFLIVPLALFAVLVLYAHAAGGVWVTIVGGVLDGIWAPLSAVGQWPWASIRLGSNPGWACVISIFAALVALSVRRWPSRALASCLVFVPLVVARPARHAEGSVVAHVLDVGHGLAVLLETRSRRLIYDAGPLYRSGFDTGEEIVLPAVYALGWKHVDVVLISHADNDHSGGAAAISRTFPGARVISGPDAEAQVEHCESGREWDWDGVAFEILHPSAAFPYRGNDSSCVLRVQTRNGTLLLTGDIEAAGERALLSQTADLAADVVVVPHHGSATSSSSAFVAAVDPDYALVSAGYRNQWGFPRPDVVEQWKRVGAEVWVTGSRGAIRVELGPMGDVSVQAARQRNRRYWLDDIVQ